MMRRSPKIARARSPRSGQGGTPPLGRIGSRRATGRRCRVTSMICPRSTLAMTRLRFCWSSRIEITFLMYNILYDTYIFRQVRDPGIRSQAPCASGETQDWAAHDTSGRDVAHRHHHHPTARRDSRLSLWRDRQFSRRMLAWRVADTFAPGNSVTVLLEPAGRGALRDDSGGPGGRGRRERERSGRRTHHDGRVRRALAFTEAEIPGVREANRSATCITRSRSTRPPNRGELAALPPPRELTVARWTRMPLGEADHVAE